MTALIKVASVLIGVAGGCAAQYLPRQRAHPDHLPIIRTDANLVLVPVTVTDDHGTAVLGLVPGDFVLKERQEGAGCNIAFAGERSHLARNRR